MYNIAIRMSGSKEEANDILQDAFIKAFTGIAKLKNEAAFGGWLKQITINLCLDYRKKSKPVFNTEILDKSSLNELAEEEIEDTINEQLVHETIKKLPDGAREILVLKALEGYRHAEIADKLGITESTSKTQYFRAKQLLGRMLKKEINERESGEIFKREKAKS